MLTRNAYSEAEAFFESYCLKSPKDADAWFSLGVTRHQQKKFEAALLAFERALYFDRHNIAAHNARANMLAEMGRKQDALDALNQTLELEPESCRTLTNLGALLFRMGDFEEALNVLDRSLSMEPNQIEALRYRARTFLTMERAEDALTDARRLADQEEIAEAYCLQTIALLLQNLFDDALHAAKHAQQLDPRSIQVLLLCSLAHAAKEEFDEAEALFSLAETQDASGLGVLLAEQALKLPKPLQSNPLELYLSLTLRRLDECDWHNLSEFHCVLENYLEQVDQISGQDADRHLLEAACVSDTNPLLRLELAKFIALATRTRIRPFMHAPRLEPERLRIGYLAHSFDGEAMTRHTAGIFSLHDRSRFEVIGYSLDPGDQSALNSRIKHSCDRYTELFPLTPLAAAERIAQDDIHLLIDLTEVGYNHPYEIFQYRPAPVQISFGDPYSTGCRAMQYRITDHVATDQAGQDHWVEKLISLPDSHCLYDHMQSVKATAPDRRELGLPPDQWVLCAFASPRAIEPEIFAAWMQILRQVEDSVLWLLEWTPTLRKNLQREAISSGINPKRLIFAAPEYDSCAHVTRLKAADLFLDTQITNSLIARDALWVGLPVITIKGETMAQRLTASQLETLDMSNLITETFNDYVEKVNGLLARPAFLQITHRKLQRHVINRPLFNTQQTVLNLEAAYEAAWQQFQRGLPPEPLDIQLKFETQ